MLNKIVTIAALYMVGAMANKAVASKYKMCVIDTVDDLFVLGVRYSANSAKFFGQV